MLTVVEVLSSGGGIATPMKEDKQDKPTNGSKDFPFIAKIHH